MKLVTTRDATRLTGLSTEQLREWTSRRELIPPDVKPKGHGSPARYSWQTILLLRLAVVLRDRFRLELQAHRDLFAELGAGLACASFLSLWGKTLVLHGGAQWSLIDPCNEEIFADDCILLRLDTHLQHLSDGFSMPRPLPASQFQLFPTLDVRASNTANNAAAGHRRHG